MQNSERRAVVVHDRDLAEVRGGHELDRARRTGVSANSASREDITAPAV